MQQIRIHRPLPQTLVAKVARNFRRRLETCVEKAGRHIEHVTLYIPYVCYDRNFAFAQLFNCRLFFSTCFFQQPSAFCVKSFTDRIAGVGD